MRQAGEKACADTILSGVQDQPLKFSSRLYLRTEQGAGGVPDLKLPFRGRVLLVQPGGSAPRGAKALLCTPATQGLRGPDAARRLWRESCRQVRFSADRHGQQWHVWPVCQCVDVTP